MNVDSTLNEFRTYFSRFLGYERNNFLNELTIKLKMLLLLIIIQFLDRSYHSLKCHATSTAC